jgi:organic radical activating enzyme
MYAYTAAEIANLEQRLAETLDRISPEFRTPNQLLGQKRTIGCVALEITQRCNLDCSICYLSENSESTPDIPLDTIFRRLDRIAKDYGVGTNVQITGGDPTLRDHDELERIVRGAVERKLFPALFTNGINASRELLQRLAGAGLVDVAFHVDLTEKRKGYRSEVQLNEVRHEYVERARGLGLNVIFNQTVFSKNFAEVPDIVRFYKQHADVVGMASFQLQADTGRGANRRRKSEVDLDSVSRQIEAGLGAPLVWDAIHVGHPDCHRMAYAGVFGSGEHVACLFDDPQIVAEMMAVVKDTWFDRRNPPRAVVQALQAAYKAKWIGKGARYFGRRVLENWRPLLEARGKVHKLSFFMQNFQDAENLDHERIDNCSFHCMTEDGGVSMCVHNAYRDHYLEGGKGYPEGYQQLRSNDGFHPCRPGGHGAPAAAK